VVVVLAKRHSWVVELYCFSPLSIWVFLIIRGPYPQLKTVVSLGLIFVWGGYVTRSLLTKDAQNSWQKREKLNTEQVTVLFRRMVVNPIGLKIVLVNISINVWIRSRSVNGQTGRPFICRHGLSFRIYCRVVNWGGHTAVRLAYRIVLSYVLREYFLNKTALERQSAWVTFLLAGWKPAVKGNSVGPATWSFIRSPRGRLQGPGSAEEDAGSFGTRTANRLV